MDVLEGCDPAGSIEVISRASQNCRRLAQAVQKHPSTSVFVNFASFRSVHETTMEARPRGYRCRRPWFVALTHKARRVKKGTPKHTDMQIRRHTQAHGYKRGYTGAQPDRHIQRHIHTHTHTYAQAHVIVPTQNAPAYAHAHTHTRTRASLPRVPVKTGSDSVSRVVL